MSDAQYLQPPLEPNPSSLERLARQYLEDNVDGWTPAEGNLEVREIAAHALMDAQLIEAASDGSTAIFRELGSFLGIPPHEARNATGTTTWTAIDTLGHEIPAGTIAVWVDSGGRRHGLETIEAANIEAGKSSVTGVAVRAQEPGSSSDFLNGAATELNVELPAITSVTLTSPTTGGEDAETESAYLTRLKEELRVLSRKAITPSDFNTILLGMAPIGRVTTLRGFNPTGTVKAKGTLKSASAIVTAISSAITEQLVIGTTVTGAGIPANTYIIGVGKTTITLSANATETKENELTFTGIQKQAGYVCSYAGTAAGENLTSEQEEGIKAEVNAGVLAGVNFVMAQPTRTVVNVIASIFAWPGQNPELIKQAVEAAITAYLSPENWGQPPGGQNRQWNIEPKVRLTNIEHIVLQTLGTHYVSELKLNGGEADLSLPGVVPLPKLGTMEITVVNG